MSRKHAPILIWLLLASSCTLALLRTLHRPARDKIQDLPSVAEQALTRIWALEEGEKRMDATAWAKERAAERKGAVFDTLWDRLNGATNRFEVLASFSVGRIHLGDFRKLKSVCHGLEERESLQSAVWSGEQWSSLLRGFAHEGWILNHVEFRQTAFETDARGEVTDGTFYLVADASQGELRATLTGSVFVHWRPTTGNGQPRVESLDATKVVIRTWKGSPGFRAVLAASIPTSEGHSRVDPPILILYDLDGDGLSEIILPESNLVYYRRGVNQYVAERLCAYEPGRVSAAVIADFDNDGAADLLCATPEGLMLFKGTNDGRFPHPPRLAWRAPKELRDTQVITCGDIDHSGSLSVFLGQYKAPYVDGQMPFPYYNANDGNPAYLLLNDGHGNFRDATANSGLAAKRFRRSYSASFVRLGTHQDLDLVVVSDFAGIDLYRNDGHGHFTDETSHWVKEPAGFGMAHTFADFNRDGLLDLLMIGMDSPTVDRLEHQHLWRPDVQDDRTMRSQIAFGNRLYLALPQGGFEQTTLNDNIARSGWSWGCASPDLDNDGFPDICIATGHETRASVRDYEPEFWLHDIYLRAPRNDEATICYFQNEFSKTRARGLSYGGNQRARIYLNREGESFVEAAHLMGLDLPVDSRSAVADDLNGDGRMDLILTTYEVWPKPRRTLRVFQNDLPDVGNWIGFRFREQGGGCSTIGASVTVYYAGHRATRQIVAGDSFSSQAAATLHFGLAHSQQVERAEVVWANGARATLSAPSINQYHWIMPGK